MEPASPRKHEKGLNKRFFTNWRIALIGVFSFAVLFYLPSLMGRLVWEDPQLISGQATGGNTLKGAFTKPFLSSYFRPLTSVSFQLDRKLGDGTPMWFHQTNILLHAGTAVMICLLTFLLTRRKIAAVVAGLVFAVQPAQVGAVAWIGGRTDALCCFFITLFLTTLVKYHQTKKGGWLLASCITFLAAALAKEQAIALAPAIPLSVFGFGSRKWRDAILISVPFFIAGIVFAALLSLPGKTINREFGDFTFQLPILTASDYGAAFLLPTSASQLTFTLNHFQDVQWILFGVFVLAGCAWLTFYLWKRNPPMAWILICGLLLYLPVSNFVAVPSFLVAPYRMAETGVCLSCLFGFAAALAYSARKYAVNLALAANLAASIYVTWTGIQTWASPVKFNLALEQRDPHFVQSQLYLMEALDESGDHKTALAHINRTLAWLYGNDEPMQRMTPAKLGSSEPMITTRLLTNFGKPNLTYMAEIFSRQAKELLKLGKVQEAEAATQNGLFYAPTDSVLNYMYGWQILSKNRPEAIHRWEISLESNPDFPESAIALGHQRLIDKRFPEAARLLEKGLEQRPFVSYAWLDLCDARTAMGDYAGALSALDTASRIFPDQKAIALKRARISSLMRS